MTQAIMVLDRESELELPVVTVAEPERPRFLVPLLLAAGWGALFTFSVVFLMDEGRIDTSSMAEESAALVEVTPGPPRMEATRIPPLTAQTVRPVNAVLADLPATGDATGEDLPSPQATALEPAQRSGPQRPDVRAEPRQDMHRDARQDSAAPDRPSFVGTWGPNARACGARANRRGFLPAVITENGARAGRTQCRFRNARRDGPAWMTLADCSDGAQRWTSQVRLTVSGDRLNWSSEKGPAVYVRCGRREG